MGRVGWVTTPARGIADEKVSNGRRTRARASLAPGDDRSGDKAVANAAITTNRGTSVPPSGAARALHRGFCLSRSPPHRRTRWRRTSILCRSKKPTGAGSCKAKAIGSYASGMMKSWRIPRACAHDRRERAAASPLPSPPPARGRALSWRHSPIVATRTTSSLPYLRQSIEERWSHDRARPVSVAAR